MTGKDIESKITDNNRKQMIRNPSNKLKGILYAAVSSSTFGLAPFFSILLLSIGFS